MEEIIIVETLVDIIVGPEVDLIQLVKIIWIKTDKALMNRKTEIDAMVEIESLVMMKKAMETMETMETMGKKNYAHS